jgi:enamine deaminase RidA (YjgF/YER057c/UK114 family)
VRKGTSGVEKPARPLSFPILPVMTDIEILNPEAVRPPAGTYSHVARVPPGASLVVIAGQVGVAPDGTLDPEFEAQCDQVFANLGAALEACGARWANVIQTMTFLTRREDIPRLRAWREREFGRLFPDGRYPPSTLLVVSGLASEEMLIEAQAIAAI